MKVMKLKDITEFPSYVEHFGNFYIISIAITGDTYIQGVTTGNSMPVEAKREMNVFSEDEYRELLVSRLGTLQEAEDALEGSVADNNFATPEESITEQKAKLSAEVAAMNDNGEGVAGDAPVTTAPVGNASPSKLAELLNKNKQD